MADNQHRFQIRIGCFDYSVLCQPGFGKDWGDKDVNGDCDSDGLEIRLDTSLPIQKQFQTIWHEVLHAVADNADLDLGKQEERIIDLMAQGVVQVIRDNYGLGNLSKFQRDMVGGAGGE